MAQFHFLIEGLLIAYIIIIFGRFSSKTDALRLQIHDEETTQQRLETRLREEEERHRFNTRLISKIGEAVFNRGGWTYSPGVYDLMKLLAAEHSFGAPGKIIEITLERDTDRYKARRLFGEAVFNYFGIPIPDKGDSFLLAHDLLSDFVEKKGLRPTVFIRLKEPPIGNKIGRFGFAGEIRGGLQARRFVLIVKIPPEGEGAFTEALANLLQF